MRLIAFISGTVGPTEKIIGAASSSSAACGRASGFSGTVPCLSRLGFGINMTIRSQSPMITPKSTTAGCAPARFPSS